MEIINITQVPKPGVSSAYSFGWGQMKKHFLYLFIISFIMGLLISPLSAGNASSGFSVGKIILQFFSAAVIFLVVTPIDYGAQYLYLKMARDQVYQIGELFDGFKNYLNIIIANLLVTALVALGFIMLVIPGIIVACRLCFVPYIIMDQKLDPIKAVEKSWQMTRGHGWKIFGIAMTAIPIFIAGLICMIVGVLFSIMWIHMAFASLYYSISAKDDMQSSRLFNENIL
jgi:uncharacterized membrane protein